MARFDVYKMDGGVVVDCQTEILRHLKTRFVIPLLPAELEPPETRILNPLFFIGSHHYVLFPQFASSVRLSDLNAKIGSLAENDTEILRAIDMLVSGF